MSLRSFRAIVVVGLVATLATVAAAESGVQITRDGSEP